MPAFQQKRCVLLVVVRDTAKVFTRCNAGLARRFTPRWLKKLSNLTFAQLMSEFQRLLRNGNPELIAAAYCSGVFSAPEVQRLVVGHLALYGGVLHEPLRPLVEAVERLNGKSTRICYKLIIK